LKTENVSANRPDRGIVYRALEWNKRGRGPLGIDASQSAQRSYERYLALAQEEVRSGNVVGAENYYQHAEHYFRLMRGAT